MNENNLAPLNKKLTCEICGCELSHAETLRLSNMENIVCQSFDCLHIMDQKTHTPPLQFELQVTHRRKCSEDLQRKQNAKRKFLEESSRRENEENNNILNYILTKQPELLNEIDQSVVIPRGLNRPIPLTQDRLVLFTQHLKTIINEAEAHINSENQDLEQHSLEQHKETRENFIKIEQQFIDNPAMKTGSDKFCSICKGGCCTSGKEHAYLSAINIIRCKKMNPHLSATDILNLYLSNLPSETIAGACINQTYTGCAQPKELRSDTCNSFYCDSLKTYHAKFNTEEAEKTILLIQRSGTCWNQMGSGVNNEVVNVGLIKEDSKSSQFFSREFIQRSIESE